MTLLFALAFIAGGVVFLKRLFGVTPTKEDQEYASRAGHAISSAIPKAFGGQIHIPDVDTSDRIEPPQSNVYVIGPPEKKPTHHPFRANLEGTSAVDDAPAPKPKRKPKKRRRPPNDDPAV
jgi:hypothetical protein